jgi:UDP-3-O-[3-hydroxymyristoyl] glucosamine N-acyltransferase
MKGFEIGKIDDSAIIGDNVKLGRNITIGRNAIVYDNVSLGDNTVIGPNCIVGEPTMSFYRESEFENPVLEIGPDSIVRSGSILYAGSRIGKNFECGNRVSIREDTKIGAHCRVGTLSDLRGNVNLENIADCIAMSMWGRRASWANTFGSSHMWC